MRFRGRALDFGSDFPKPTLDPEPHGNGHLHLPRMVPLISALSAKQLHGAWLFFGNSLVLQGNQT